MFNKNNAHILKNIKDTEPYYNMSNALVNPSLKNIQRVHSMFWEPRGEALHKMSEKRMARRQKKVAREGLDMTVKPQYKASWTFYSAFIIAIGAICASLSRYF